MASPADRLRAIREPALPGVGMAMRAATSELWFHWTAALAANVAWTVAVLLLVAVAAAWPLGALLLAPLTALPVAGLYRVAGLVVRGEEVRPADAWVAWRTHGGRAALLGLGVTLGLVILAADVVVGLAGMGGPLGWALATGAAWGLLFGWSWLLHTWPLLLDPGADRGLREAAVLGARTALLFPGRAFRLAVVTTLLLLVAAVLFASLATFAMAWVAILGAVVVLPAADRIMGVTPTPAERS